MKLFSTHKSLTEGVVEVDVEPAKGGEYYYNLTACASGFDEYLRSAQLFEEYNDAKIAALNAIEHRQDQLHKELKRLEKVKQGLTNENY